MKGQIETGHIEAEVHIETVYTRIKTQQNRSKGNRGSQKCRCRYSIPLYYSCSGGCFARVAASSLEDAPVTAPFPPTIFSSPARRAAAASSDEERGPGRRNAGLGRLRTSAAATGAAAATWAICNNNNNNNNNDPRRAGKLYKARSRPYRCQILQVNTRWKRAPLN